MKTKTINLYQFSELAKEVQEKVIEKFRSENDYHFLSDYMNERLHELLKENHIKDTNDTSKPGTKPTQVLYSLSCSQGDGAMFEGVYLWNGYTVTITQHGYYSRGHVTSIEDNDGNKPSEAVYKEFDALYVFICKQLERDGYSFIEAEDAEEYIIENIEANDYTFRENGTIENA